MRRTTVQASSRGRSGSPNRRVTFASSRPPCRKSSCCAGPSYRKDHRREASQGDLVDADRAPVDSTDTILRDDVKLWTGCPCAHHRKRHLVGLPGRRGRTGVRHLVPSRANPLQFKETGFAERSRVLPSNGRAAAAVPDPVSSSQHGSGAPHARPTRSSIFARKAISSDCSSQFTAEPAEGQGEGGRGDWKNEALVEVERLLGHHVDTPARDLCGPRERGSPPLRVIPSSAH